MSNIDANIRKLAALRQKISDAREKTDELKRKFEASPAWRAAADTIAAAAKDAAELDTAIRAEAVQEYNASAIKSKKPHDAVGIKENTILEYLPAAALEYCKQNAPTLLKLDTTGFEKLARANLETAARLPFVTTRKEPSATIATDLSKYLEKE